MAWINEIYDVLFHPDTICVANISYGKDSLAMLRAIKHLGLPLHRIVHSEVWATDTIPADLPPMVEFKKHADRIIKELYGIEVEHICATRPVYSQSGNVERERATNQCSIAPCRAENSQELSKASPKPLGDGAKSSRPRVKLTYEDIFYRRYKAPKEGRKEGRRFVRIPDQVVSLVQRRTQGLCPRQASTDSLTAEGADGATNSNSVAYGFPISINRGQWCQRLKLFSERPGTRGGKHIVQYLGIAADEPLRTARHITKPNIILPLVEIGWEEDLCGLIAGYQDLLSPTYTTSTRGGCWFCHNQGVDQLRQLRRNYPDLWALLLKWDADSPVTFHSDGHTVADFDARFAMEDEGLVSPGDIWRWEYLNNFQLKINFNMPI